jgi:hypothetical protein
MTPLRFTASALSTAARWALMLTVPLALALGCPGTGSTGDGDGDGDGDDTFGPIAFEDFVQDRPAVGGDWYLYDEAGGHVLTPYAQAYLVREMTADAPRYAAVKIDSYYDPDTAESGTFTFQVKTWDGAWSAATEHVTHNIKSDDGPYCFDAFAAAEVDCEGTAWQFNFRIYKFLVRTGPIVVARPGLFARQAPLVDDGPPVFLATLETDNGLDGLPNPTTVDDLDDGPPLDWGDPTYTYANWTPNLPTAGRVLGPRWVDDGHVGRPDVYFLLDAQTNLVRFTITPVTDGDRSSDIHFTFSTVAVERNERTIPSEVPEPTEVDVPPPAAGQMLFVDFDAGDLRLSNAELEGSDPPDLVPDEGSWQLALEGFADRVEVRVSSGAILYNATAGGDGSDLMEATPPQ